MSQLEWQEVLGGLVADYHEEPPSGKVFVQCTVCPDAKPVPLVGPVLEWCCPDAGKHPGDGA